MKGLLTKKTQLDNIDYRLIQDLQNNGRRSNTELARRLGISEATVRRRVRKLEAEGVIRIVAMLDHHKIGYGVKAIIMLEVSLSKIEEVVTQLAENHNVHYIVQCTGGYNLLFWVFCHSTEELAKFVSTRLARMDGVKGSRIAIEVQLFKRTTDLLPTEIPVELLYESEPQK
jgi:Lrp/AsnC family transcriptional regulator for asnA, asnC and gidA